MELVDRAWRLALTASYRLVRIYWFLFRPTWHGVYVALWWRGRILVIENSYRGALGLPAGGMRRREAAVDAAVRELREEVGIVLAPDALRYAGEFVTNVNHLDDHGHFFEIELADEPRVAIDRREVVAASFLTLDEALERRTLTIVRQYLERVAARTPRGAPPALLAPRGADASP